MYRRFAAMQANDTRIVLCAEDDPDDKELFCQTATQINPKVEVVHADNGLQLLEKLGAITIKGKKPCLIVLDMNMPVMGGRETVERINENAEWASIPVCLYSTSPRHLYLDLELKYGVVIVRKPDNMKDIIETVAYMLSYCKD